MRALEAGKHVLCEKPLSRRVADVERAFDVAERAGLVLMEGFMFRHHPQSARLLQLVEGGAVGRVRLIRGSFGFVAGGPADGRLSAALEGGALMDLGCYCVSSARLLAGEPLSVTAQSVIGGDGVDVVFTGTVRFSGDVLAEFDSGLVVAMRDELEVVGDEGSLFLDDPWLCRAPAIELRREGVVETFELAQVNSYRLEAENLGAAVRGEAVPLLGRADAIAQARAIEALYEAAGSGRTVSLAVG